MAMFGGYAEGGKDLPRVMHISIARYLGDLPTAGRPLEFLVSIHEEGTGISWQQNVTVDLDTEKYFVDTAQDLYLWSLGEALTADRARTSAAEMGSRLYDTFIGEQGTAYLADTRPTAVLLDVDETTLNLPWELIADDQGPISQDTPFGRLVTTRVIPRRGRDPIAEDALVHILAVANPTTDLSATEAEVAMLSSLDGRSVMGRPIKVDVLTREVATLARFKEMVAAADYDILHFAGHALLDPDEPGASQLKFADVPLPADDVLALPWKTNPPYFVFNSGCETGRGLGGRRLASDQNRYNGLAAAFLASGVLGYAGYFWPVTDTGAGIFADTFYSTLFERENVGLAFRAARNRTLGLLTESGDLTAFSAILFGDAASAHRRDLATAV